MLKVRPLCSSGIARSGLGYKIILVHCCLFQIAKRLTAVVGNLLDANETVIIESNFKDHASDR